MTARNQLIQRGETMYEGFDFVRNEFYCSLRNGPCGYGDTSEQAAQDALNLAEKFEKIRIVLLNPNGAGMFAP